jgi:diguanylate cyclase (GGDEF)-like protein
VIADTATSVLIIEQQIFWALVSASHAVARNILLMVVERMRANNALVADGVHLREQCRRQVNVDELTGLRNRRALEDLLRRQLLRSSMNSKITAVLIVDIDDFQRFTREFGRVAGDQAICTVAQTLQDQVRPTDIVARLDGEKFAVILPESDEEGARIVATRLRDAVSEAVIVMADESILPPVTVSIGMAEMQPFERADQLLQDADKALARAKTNGRNTFSN